MDINAVRNLVRTGVVSSVNEANCTARVTFGDKDNLVSAELSPLCRGSQKNKDYWLPDIGEQVVCLFLPNSKNLTQGWILGTYFSAPDPPPAGSVDTRIFDFGDGTHISYDRKTHALSIRCMGEIKLSGTKINLN